MSIERKNSLDHVLMRIVVIGVMICTCSFRYKRLEVNARNEHMKQANYSTSKASQGQPTRDVASCNGTSRYSMSNELVSSMQQVWGHSQSATNQKD